MWSVNIAQKRLNLLKRSESTNGDKKKASDPILLVSKISNQFVVKRCCHEATSCGVQIGASLAQARALTTSPRIEKFNPERDFRAIYRLANWALRYTPVVGIDSELVLNIKEGKDVRSLFDGLVLDISGTERLHKTETNLAKDILSYFNAASIESRIGISPTIGASWAISRFKKSPVSIIGEQDLIKNHISDLPVDALRISSQTIHSLNEIGIYNIKDILKLPKRSIFQRFPEIPLRIDQALGDMPEIINCVEPPIVLSAAKSFETPVSNENDIKKVSFILLKNLLGKLQDRSQGICILSLELETKAPSGNKGLIRKEIPLNSPVKDFEKILPVLNISLENTRILGGVIRFKLTASNTEKISTSQLDFLSPAISNHSIDDLINTLIAKIGRENVTTVTFNNSHIPEKSFKHTTILDKQENPCDYPDLDRPSYILTKPEPVLAISMMPDKPPSWLKWKGKKHKIIKSFGPERISDEWWHSSSIEHIKDRDYFKVQDDTGRWLWVYRESLTMKWFIHGVWG